MHTPPRQVHALLRAMLRDLHPVSHAPPAVLVSLADHVLARIEALPRAALVLGAVSLAEALASAAAVVLAPPPPDDPQCLAGAFVTPRDLSDRRDAILARIRRVASFLLDTIAANPSAPATCSARADAERVSRSVVDTARATFCYAARDSEAERISTCEQVIDFVVHEYELATASIARVVHHDPASRILNPSDVTDTPEIDDSFARAIHSSCDGWQCYLGLKAWAAPQVRRYYSECFAEMQAKV
ncbi:hypothetical protein HDU83_005280 [Entophlyctis luteolus]|nr:hypothetical protein HDU83_005280 [Entophlyctis luteolus]